ncbi:hypothetical protein KXS07_35940 [Inquilinus limosus]|uniref:hypothetical protein n=1 Tax=Inquilinus limosus TaxID=171674 RepID=UPI003F137AF6
MGSFVNDVVWGGSGDGYLGAAGFSGKAGELRYEHQGGDTVVQGDTMATAKPISRSCSAAQST